MVSPMPEPSDVHPRLNRADAWLLAALTESSHDGRPVTLRDLVHDADWLNRAIPTFDEMSFGLPRLIAAGFMTVGVGGTSGVDFRASSEATKLRKSIKAETLGGVLAAVAEAVGAAPYPESEPPEDRSLGRLPGLEPDDLEVAIREHGEWVERWSKPFVGAARALTRWQNRNRS